jgi:hypothetical protein
MSSAKIFPSKEIEEICLKMLSTKNEELLKLQMLFSDIYKKETYNFEALSA